MNMNLGRLWEMVGAGRAGVLQSMGSQRVGHGWATEQHHHQHSLLVQHETEPLAHLYPQIPPCGLQLLFFSTQASVSWPSLVCTIHFRSSCIELENCIQRVYWRIPLGAWPVRKWGRIGCCSRRAVSFQLRSQWIPRKAWELEWPFRNVPTWGQGPGPLISLHQPAIAGRLPLRWGRIILGQGSSVWWKAVPFEAHIWVLSSTDIPRIWEDGHMDPEKGTWVGITLSTTSSALALHGLVGCLL